MTRRKRTEWLAPVSPEMAAADHSAALGAAVEYFRAAFPEAWEGLRLCPLQHGAEAMGDTLRSAGRFVRE